MQQPKYRFGEKVICKRPFRSLDCPNFISNLEIQGEVLAIRWLRSQSAPTDKQLGTAYDYDLLVEGVAGPLRVPEPAITGYWEKERVAISGDLKAEVKRLLWLVESLDKELAEYRSREKL
jgi:hypothetical protein